MTPTAVLFLALTIPAAPAPKIDKGLPKDLVDLIPADTAAVLVVDVPKAAKSPIGTAILKAATAEQKPDDLIQIADFVRDAELVIVSQFLIDKAFGDFCILVRHKDGSTIPKSLIDRAEKSGKDKVPEQIGKRTVYSLSGTGDSFARIDDRTLMFVLATGNNNQVKETRAAAYGEREKPGPSQTLRKMLDSDAKEDCAIRLYGSHPTKLAQSTCLVMAPFGVKEEPLEKLGDKIVSFRGEMKMGESAEIELRVTAMDAAAAKELVENYAGGEDKDPFIKELRSMAKAVREGDELIITAKLTPAIVGRLRRPPNK
jgi:hypothetical protein